MYAAVGYVWSSGCGISALVWSCCVTSQALVPDAVLALVRAFPSSMFHVILTSILSFFATTSSIIRLLYDVLPAAAPEVCRPT